MELWIALLTLLAGAAIGWLVARQRAELALHGARTELSTLRGAISAERAALTQREELLAGTGNLAALVDPLRESLGRVHEQLTEVEKGRAVSDIALREQVRAMRSTSELLRTETAQLVAALRAPQVRGRWGELQLERVVEAAGMAEHVDFSTQVSVTTGDGTVLRPDLVVHLAGGKRVVVDSKVAFSAYLEAMQASDEATQTTRLRAHARHLRAHVDALAAKAYWEQFSPAPEFVVCFVPADAFLDAALREDASLLEHAFAHNVVLATPSTLVALLRTVAYTWRQHALAENVSAVHELGRELYQRLTTMTKHVDRLGRSLGGAVGAYNDAVGALERRVLTKARELRDLGVVHSGAPAPQVRPLTDSVPRPAVAAESDSARVLALWPPSQPGVTQQDPAP